MKTIHMFELRDLLSTCGFSCVSFLGSLELPDLLNCTLLSCFSLETEKGGENFCCQCFLLLDEELWS